MHSTNIIHYHSKITNHSLIILLLFTVLSACRHQADGAFPETKNILANDVDNTAVQVETFDRVWERIDSTYYDPDMGGVNWFEVGQELRPRALECSSPEELRPILNELVGRLGESHFAIIPGNNNIIVYSLDLDGEPSQTSGLWTNGIDIRLVPDQEGHPKATVFRVLDDSSAANIGVQTGWVLETINGDSVDTLINSLSASIPENQGQSSGIESIRFIVARTLNSLVNGDIGEPVSITFLDGSNSPHDLSINPTYREGDAVRLGHLPEVISNFNAKILEDSNIGLIDFNVFMGPIIPQFTEALQSFNQAEANGIIIDIRGNPGGISGMAGGIVGHLVSTRDNNLGEMYDRESRLTLNVFPRPRSQRFDGPIALLVDELSASTSEFLAAGIQDLNRGRIFGQTTAGMALPSTIEALPNGDLLQFVIFNMIRHNGERIEGYGVTPDEVVPLTRAELLSGEDPVLNQAIMWISEIE